MRRINAALGMLAFLAGCAGAPAFLPEDYVETTEIFRAVERELCQAIAWVDSNPKVGGEVLAAGLDIRRFVASVTVGLSVEEVADGSGNAALMIPVATGLTGVGGSLGLTTVRARNTTLKVYYPFAELECGWEKPKPPTRVAGNLGLAEWIAQTTKVLIDIKETPVSYNYSVAFTVQNAAGIGPQFRVLPAGNTLNIGAGLSGSRALTHSLHVSVVEIQPDAALAARYKLSDETRRRLDRESEIEALRGLTR
ncbi:MAG: hypothetical protein WAT70_09960 [Rhizobiaceae bacterium]